MSCLSRLFRKKNEEPPRPEMEVIVPADYKRPTILDVDITVKKYGNFRTSSGNPKGCVVHFTAGWSKGREAALNSLASLADRGLGALVMDDQGILYKAKNHALNEVVYHAGDSAWKDVTSVSYYCLGIEVCCAGKLDGQGKSWFGEVYPPEQRRYVPNRDNMEAGVYHIYTPAQELALRNFMLWQRMVNKEFSFSWVIGHDECATPKGRRNDPGGSLSRSMPEFRADLYKYSYTM